MKITKHCLNNQTIEIQKYIFLGNINYIQNIKIYILVGHFNQTAHFFHFINKNKTFKYLTHPLIQLRQYQH